MITEIEVEDVGTIRHLNAWQIHRLKTVAQKSRDVAPVAFALGMSVRQFRTLPIEKQRECWAAWGKLLSPENNGLTPAKHTPQPLRLRDLDAEQRIEIGRRLLSVKVQLPHGHFWPWIRDKSGLSENMAKSCVKAAHFAAKPSSSPTTGSSHAT